MRNTAKRIAALKTLKSATRKDQSRYESQRLYDTLEGLNYWWDAQAGEWKNTRPPSTTIFKDDEGASTGLVRVRVMGLNADAQQLITSMRAGGWTLVETSDAYPNRKGPGVRYYLTYKRD